MTVVPLGDQAALAYCADEIEAFRLATVARHAEAEGVVDVVHAYATVAVFFDPERTRFDAAVPLIQAWASQEAPAQDLADSRQHVIPCCYEMQQDLARLTEHTGLGAEEVIRLHMATEYTVYAIGFCPGFPYLGYLPEALAGVPRLPAPRLRVLAGSVGLTGRQTGIYTEARPGGWNLIGRTPLELVKVADGYFPLRTGDRVRFERIDEAEFRKLQGHRLMSAHASSARRS
jgi:inhibitor of KinA